MSSKQKRLPVSDWMYHAPSKCTTEVVGAPPPSQIPCLHGNEELPPPDMPPKMLIKESDSAYIRLAKMGGREDLLKMRSPGPKADGPVGYPRVDWFYQDDIQNEDQEGKDGAVNENYEFMLPDYMVHGDHAKKMEGVYLPNRLPYAQDQTSVYEREGLHPNDKTVKIKEAQAAGYGVRQNKNAAAIASKKINAPIERTQICKPPSPQIGLPAKQFKPIPSPKEEGIQMGKLLSFGYLDDWTKDRDDWADKQQKYRDKNPDKTVKTSQTKPPPKANLKINGTNSRVDEDKPEFFKMSKFKNVPSKTSHRRPEGNSEHDLAAH